MISLGFRKVIGTGGPPILRTAIWKLTTADFMTSGTDHQASNPRIPEEKALLNRVDCLRMVLRHYPYHCCQDIQKRRTSLLIGQRLIQKVERVQRPVAVVLAQDWTRM